MTAINKEVSNFAKRIASRFDKRIAAAEATSSATKNLNEARAKLVAHAATLLAANFDIDFIDGANNRDCNVYALKHKSDNICNVLEAKDSLNHYTRALLLTARNLHNANLDMTTRDAACACDGNFKAKSAHEKMIVCTSEKNNANTNSTQQSSSLVALQAFKILTKNGKAFKLDVENETYKRLMNV